MMTEAFIVVVTEQRDRWRTALERAQLQSLRASNRQQRYDGLAKITTVTVTSSRPDHGPYTATVRRDNGVYTVTCDCESRAICKHAAVALWASGDFDVATTDNALARAGAALLLAPRNREQVQA